MTSEFLTQMEDQIGQRKESLVGYCADDGLERAEDASEGEGDEHGEEEGRPEVGGRHPRQHLGVHDEGEAGTSAQHLKCRNGQVIECYEVGCSLRASF